MEKELAERIAMALEGIEAELKRAADVHEASLEMNKSLIAEQRDAARMMQAQLGGRIISRPDTFRG